jgi:ABC-type antimicrobial peptide transport system permease subunit
MLADSIFQSELLVAEEAFVRAFPREEGYRMLLIESDPATAAGLSTLLEDRLSDYGLDLQPTGDRLASYHRVENTYISTFQALGALGLLLGTCGVGALVLRGVLERRRELAVLRAVGYRAAHVTAMVVAEGAMLAVSGTAIGVACAWLAIIPALAAHGAGAPHRSSMLLALCVVGVAMLSSLGAAVAVARMPVAATIRTE